MPKQDSLDRPSQFEIRVDGVSVARHALIEAALRAGLAKKQNLYGQLVTLHDLRFKRIWTIDQSGRVTPSTPSPSKPEAS